jgi:hypothetical protein
VLVHLCSATEDRFLSSFNAAVSIAVATQSNYGQGPENIGRDLSEGNITRQTAEDRENLSPTDIHLGCSYDTNLLIGSSNFPRGSAY